jgi:hypothetical protein
MNYTINTSPDAYGETPEHLIPIIQHRELAIASALGIAVEYVQDQCPAPYGPEPDEAHALLCTRIWECAMECADPDLTDRPEFAAAVAAARAAYPLPAIA